jgi:hypothetical protein
MTLQATFRRITRVFALCLLAVGLLALAAPAAVASDAATSSDIGWLRLAHLSPNAPAVDVYLYSFGDSSAKVVLKHVSYGTISPYQAVASGEYSVAMRAADSTSTSAVIVSATLKVAPGHAYTVAGMGPVSALRLQVLSDQLSTPPGRALVRVIQASLQEHQVSVDADTQVLASDLPFASVTTYESVAPGTWKVHVSGGTESAAMNVKLSAGAISTLVVLDQPGGLKITDLTDAAGSKVLPAGGAGTGLGGMAARPGSSPLPWLLAVAAGAVIAVAGTLRLRRPRRAAGTRRVARAR